MENFNTIVIGGGAAGLTAAISAARKGKTVCIAEKMPRTGKKILASGGGRCNLLNDSLGISFYNEDSRELIEPVFKKTGREEILDFFHALGLYVYSDQGRVFPITNQASSVLEVLELELRRLGVRHELNCEITHLKQTRNGFILKSKNGKELSSPKVILACGGKSYPALGADGNGYKFARDFGHTLIFPVPSTVPLLVKDPMCHALQGQRIFALVTTVIRGREIQKLRGELLFTKYGLSGTVILDVSEKISVAINRDHIKDVSLKTDLCPFLDEQEFEKIITSRLSGNVSPEHLLAGILPGKFSPVLSELLKMKDIRKICRGIKHKHFDVAGTRGWNEAEFTAGGIDTREINPENLESKLVPHLYFAGEMLNVQGRRGGYNLAWAWASGLLAGLNQ